MVIMSFLLLFNNSYYLIRLLDSIFCPTMITESDQFAFLPGTFRLTPTVVYPFFDRS